MSLTQAEITGDLRRLRLPAGAVVALHSSLSSLGHVEGGADTVIDAMLDVLGPDGTLVAPTFTYCFKGYQPGGVFDRHSSPSHTGLVTETLRRRREAVRSFHPTHSAAAIGPLAVEITRDHLKATPLGENSPFHRVALHDGWILLIGCSHNSSSFIHTAEVVVGLSYVRVYCWLHRAWEPEASFLDESGKTRRLAIYECPGCSASFDKLGPELRDRGQLREGKVGQADAQLMKTEDLLGTVRQLTQGDPGYLLCEPGRCATCDVRRAAIDLPTPPPLPSSDSWVLE